MFGFLTLDVSSLSDEQKLVYRSEYCGICKALKSSYGSSACFSLQYDMTFLALLLDSLYEPEIKLGFARCLPHPVAPHKEASSPFISYAADMNVALAYWKLLDDWRDEKRLDKLAASKLLKSAFDASQKKWPRQCGAIIRCMDELAAIEASGTENPDAGANVFGYLMGELFTVYEDNWAYNLRRIGIELGRFIYIADAAIDLHDDYRHGRYNPLAVLAASGHDLKWFHARLEEILGACCLEFEKLPLDKNVDIMRNILRNGVWTKWQLKYPENRKPEEA